MKTLITATFICEEEDTEYMKEDLEKWFQGCNVDMEYHHIWHNDLHYTKYEREIVNDDS